MEDTTLKQKLMHNSLLLSIILHLLFLLAISTALFLQPEPKKKPPSYYVPSYAAQAPTPPMPPQTSAASYNEPKQVQEKKAEQNQQKTDKTEPKVEETKQQNEISLAKKPPMKKSMLTASHETLKQMHHNAISSNRESDPIYLVGDRNEEADPLMKLVGRALSRHFEYPKSAGEFGITGTVLVGFTLHPEGYITDVRVIRSSNKDDLDSAALYAVNAAPTIQGTSNYIDKPKYIIIGFIFRLVRY